MTCPRDCTCDACASLRRSCSSPGALRLFGRLGLAPAELEAFASAWERERREFRWTLAVAIVLAFVAVFAR